ncbi:PucR family transcriptional regulator [Pseudonocardiaceae bacterium YIM PH 21723]|nr:PucR family transcriptional regulator [Pseudonocardiaceae bacterium YIM PH 21723]
MSSVEPAGWRDIAVELLERQQVVTARIALKVRSGATGYAELSVDQFDAPHAENMAFLLRSIEGYRMPTAVERTHMREFGALRATQGIGLEDFLQGGRVASRELLAEIIDIGRIHNVTDAFLLTATNYMLDLTDQFMLAFTAGHRQAELSHARLDEQQRADFTRALLLGSLESTHLVLRAQHHGIDPDRTYVPFRAIAPLPANGALTFTTTIDGDHAGFTDTLTHSGDQPIGHGPAVRLNQLPGSFALATRALRTAITFHRSGSYNLGDLGLLPAVLADPDTGDQLVHRYLPSIPEIDATILTTLHTYLETGQNVDRTATKLIVHSNTIRYRLKRYQDFTGIDLRAPEIPRELWWALRRHEVLRPRQARVIEFDS